MTDTVMRPMTFEGSSDSAAAMVAISAPTRLNMVDVAAASTTPQPLGTKPSCAVKLPKVEPPPEVRPKAHAAQTRMNTMIAATLIDENQNSNSPYARADIRFTAVKIAIRAMPMPSSGTAGNHPCKICAPAIASIATTTTQKYQ